MKQILLLPALLVITSLVTAKGKFVCELAPGIQALNLQKPFPENTVPHYDLKTQLYYGFYNDDENLYILIQTNNADMAQNISKSGAALSIAGKYGEKVTAKLSYSPHKMRGDMGGNRPMMDGNQQARPVDRNASNNGQKNREKNGANNAPKLDEYRTHFTLERGVFTADGFLLTNGVLIMDDPVDLHAETNWPEDRFLNFFIRIPLSELAVAPYNWEKIAKKGFKMSIELQSQTNSASNGMPEPSSGGMGGSGGGNMGGGPPGGMSGGGMQGGPPGGGMGGGAPGGGPQSNSSSSSASLKFSAKILPAIPPTIH